MRWREQFTGRRRRGANKDGDHKKEVFHAFRAAPEGELKEEALKKEGKANVTQKQVVERTWTARRPGNTAVSESRTRSRARRAPPRNLRRRSNLSSFVIVRTLK